MNGKERNLVRGQENLLRLMEHSIDPSLQALIDSIEQMQQPQPTLTLVTSKEGTSNADSE